MKTNKLVGVLATLIVIGVFGYIFYVGDDSKIQTNPSVFDGQNSTFTIGSEKVTLKNGISEIYSTSGSSSKITTRYFGNESVGDLNGDGQDDIAFLVSQETGGSGIFYYVIVALKNPTGYQMTNGFFIGDRIAPQTTQINSSAKELYVNYAERKAGEPFTTRPSQGVTKYLKVTSDGILEGLMK